MADISGETEARHQLSPDSTTPELPRASLELVLQVEEEGERVVSGEEEKRVVSGEEEKRVVSGEEEKRVVSGEEEKRVVSGEEEKREVSGEEEKRVVCGEEEKRVVSGEEGEREVSGEEEKREVSGEEEKWVVSGEEEKREMSGEEEKWVVSGEEEKREVSGEEEKWVVSGEEEKWEVSGEEEKWVVSGEEEKREVSGEEEKREVSGEEEKWVVSGEEEKQVVSGEEAATDALLPGRHELEGLLEEMAGVMVVPPCGDAGEKAWEVQLMDDSLIHFQQLRLLLDRTYELQSRLAHGQNLGRNQGFAAIVRNILLMCQPYFTYLESSARSIVPPLPAYIRSTLLHYSQQLCDRLEQLVLICASYNILCLDETEPDSVSHFCIGQCQLGRVSLTTFRYCKPAPYATRAITGLYKRIRWNVERPRDNRQQQTDKEQDGETDTEYYFLCYEEVPEVQTEPGWEGQGAASGNVMKMWSIGQWIQVNPDPVTEDIYDWILCDVPQADYLKLLCLGSEEPLTCTATDYLVGLLLSQQPAE